MASDPVAWRSGPVVAFTRRLADGGRRPQAPSRSAVLALAGLLSGTVAYVPLSGTLVYKQDHWAITLFGFVFFGCFLALFLLWRGWAPASGALFAVSVGGVAIGLVDAQDDLARGLITVAWFLLAAVVTAGMAVQLLRSAARRPGPAEVAVGEPQDRPSFPSTPGTVLPSRPPDVDPDELQASQDRALRRWCRRPLWLLLVTCALAGAMYLEDLSLTDEDERAFERSYRATAEIDPDWDGGPAIDLTYRHPRTGEEVRTETYVRVVELPDGPGEVPIEVSRADPMRVALVGDRYDGTEDSWVYVVWAPFPILWWAVRRFARRTRRLAGSVATGYAMQAVPVAPIVPGRRWCLRVYPADGGPPERAVFTVPLAGTPTNTTEPFAVEVKGSPRPYGRTVIRDRVDDAILWPAGRNGPADDAPAVDRLAGAAGLLAIGVIVMVGGSGWFIADMFEGRAAGDRAETVRATVTDRTEWAGDEVDLEVAYRWEGRRRTATVSGRSDGDEGEEVTLQIDPAVPERVWLDPDAMPPDLGAVPVAVIVLGAVVSATAVLIGVLSLGDRRRSPAPPGKHGLRIVDGCLGYGTSTVFGRGPRARFERSGLVLVDDDAAETRYSWDDHADAPAPWTGPRWRFDGSPPGRGAMSGAVSLVVATMPAGGGWAVLSSGRRLAGTGWGAASWEELPALVSYLAVTPAARDGLTRPDRLIALAAALADGGWRHPGPPTGLLFGDRLALDHAVRATLGRHLPYCGGRTMGGRPVPPLDELTAEARAWLPPGTRDRIDDPAVRARLVRHLETGRWPFDLLLSEGLTTTVA